MAFQRAAGVTVCRALNNPDFLYNSQTGEGIFMQKLELTNADHDLIAEANRRAERVIETIVAVYYPASGIPKVIPPCGRCREIITDFSPAGFVILRDPGSDDIYKVRSVDLFPLKYGDYWQDG